MDITIQPGKLAGSIPAIPSKSHAHRLLICAAFADGVSELICPETNQDIEATAQCLNALGARISRTEAGYHVKPIRMVPISAELNCGESGSTLRFMLPIVGALGVDTVFHMEGRLPKRPLSPLWEEMERMGCQLSRPSESQLRCQCKLRSGSYQIDGSISSQYVTGLLFALSLLDGNSKLAVTGKLESKPYVDMTLHAMKQFSVSAEHFSFHGKQQYHTPGTLKVEGDWSNAAFFLAANALQGNVTVTNLSSDSAQGDKAVADLIPLLHLFQRISAADIPDLIPILSVVAAINNGAEFTNIQRLRLKESDRVASIIAMIESLGGRAEAKEDTLTVYGTGLTGGTVDSVNDHRIAMAAGIAATACSNPVTVINAQCVAKSYPSFWNDFCKLGGQI